MFPTIFQTIRFRRLKLDFLICLVTPTYTRLEQEPELVRLGQTLQQVSRRLPEA